MISNDNLFRIGEPFIIPIEMKRNDFGNYLQSLGCMNDNKNIILQLRGKKLKTTTLLFKEFARTFRLPSYFGKNWNALDECLNDLEWMEGDCYIVGINDMHEVLIFDDYDLDVLFEILFDTCKGWSEEKDIDKEWGRLGKPFHFLLQYESEHKKYVVERFSKYVKIK